MRTIVLLVGLALSSAGSLAAQQAPPKPVNITGKWAMTLELSIGTSSPVLELKHDGEKVTGTYTGRYGTSPLAGVLKGRALEFTVKLTAEGQDSTMSFAGEVAADGLTMRGSATIEGLGDASWSAKKTPDK